jgi:hypothetical protein
MTAHEEYLLRCMIPGHHMGDPSDDGPEVGVITFFRLHRDGLEPWFFEISRALKGLRRVCGFKS